MKLVSYHTTEGIRSGLMVNEKLYDLNESALQIGSVLPDNMLGLLRMEETGLNQARQIQEMIQTGALAPQPVTNPKLAAPLPNPPSCRDAYAFRQHVATARRNRSAEMIPEFDQFPVFYFTNHQAIYGPGDISVEADHLQKLDFELEVAIVIGKRGKNIQAQDADEHIAGFTIMNDLSARQLQMEEMKLSLGPAKGKDFATVIGPWLVTPDELKQNSSARGKVYDLELKAFHNGHQISSGNLKDMTWTFAEIIERASYGVEIFPGDVIGSGTVGTGCYLELNGTRKLEAEANNQSYEPVWLEAGDTIQLEVESLGTLTNTIHSSSTGYSILAKKKLN